MFAVEVMFAVVFKLPVEEESCNVFKDLKFVLKPTSSRQNISTLCRFHLFTKCSDHGAIHLMLRHCVYIVSYAFNALYSSQAETNPLREIKQYQLHFRASPSHFHNFSS